MTTNAFDGPLAAALSEIGDLDQGTLALISIQKKGVERGKKGAKTVYDDDVVKVLLWTGFSYEALVERTIKKMEAMSAGIIRKLHAEALKEDHNTTLDHVCMAVQEFRSSLHRVTSKPSGRVAVPDDNESVWEALTVNGVKIRRSQVYVGTGDPDNPRAPVPGTIYVDGVKLGEKVIQPAANGHWKTTRKPKTTAKDILRSWLPTKLYARYALEPGRLREEILVGSDASVAAVAAGIPVDPAALMHLFKIAA